MNFSTTWHSKKKTIYRPRRSFNILYSSSIRRENEKYTPFTHLIQVGQLASLLTTLLSQGIFPVLQRKVERKSSIYTARVTTHLTHVMNHHCANLLACVFSLYIRLISFAHCTREGRLAGLYFFLRYILVIASREIGCIIYFYFYFYFFQVKDAIGF